MVTQTLFANLQPRTHVNKDEKYFLEVQNGSGSSLIATHVSRWDYDHGNGTIYRSNSLGLQLSLYTNKKRNCSEEKEKPKTTLRINVSKDYYNLYSFEDKIRVIVDGKSVEEFSILESGRDFLLYVSEENKIEQRPEDFLFIDQNEKLITNPSKGLFSSRRISIIQYQSNIEVSLNDIVVASIPVTNRRYGPNISTWVDIEKMQAGYLMHYQDGIVDIWFVPTTNKSTTIPTLATSFKHEGKPIVGVGNSLIFQDKCIQFAVDQFNLDVSWEVKENEFMINGLHHREGKTYLGSFVSEYMGQFNDKETEISDNIVNAFPLILEDVSNSSPDVRRLKSVFVDRWLLDDRDIVLRHTASRKLGDF